MKFLAHIAPTLCLLALPSSAHAVVIDFAGGTATRFSAPLSVVTDNAVNWDNVDYYEEDGFKLDFIGNTAAGDAFAAHIGNYYAAGNAVIHGHWSSGSFGDLTEIKVTKIGGGTFDLNYFILTSNTDTGGGLASGLERAFITHDGGSDPILLPPEDWGFPASQIFLPASYDGISSFEFHVENRVDCFGMDEFYIDEEPPSRVPETGSTLALLALGSAGLAGFRWRTARANQGTPQSKVI
jgi:hypothetical protein